jgi:hypothetical protein
MVAVTKFFVAFFSVCGLTMISVWLFRLVRRQRTGRTSRLEVIDITLVDEHRCLLLVRRDSIEHLVMIGGPNDVIIESVETAWGAARASPPIPERRMKAGPAGPILEDVWSVVEHPSRPHRPGPAEAPLIGPAEPMLPLYPPATSADALAPSLSPETRAVCHSDLADLDRRFGPLFDTIMRSLHDSPRTEMGEPEETFARSDERAERYMASEDFGSEPATQPPSTKTT